MKKFMLLSAVFCFSHILLKSQVYAGLGFGYGLPIAKDVVGTNSENNNPANTFSEDNVYGSYGSGASAHAYVGYWFTDMIGVDLGVNYLAGRKYTFTSHSVNSSNVTNDQTDDVWARALRLTPALRIGLGNGDIHPYFLAGLSIGVMNKLTDDYTRTFTNPPAIDVTHVVTEYTRGLPVGGFAALGADFHVSETVLFNVELTNYLYNWAPLNADITEFTVNGADEVPGMTNDEKHFEFVDHIDQTMNVTSSQPTMLLKQYFPMSSLGLTVGIHFAFGGTVVQ